MKYKIQLCKGRDYCVVDGIGRLVEMILDAQHRGFREPIISTIEPKDGIYTYQLTAGDTDRDRVQVPPDDPPEESWAFKAGWMAREAFEHGKTSQQHRSDAVARLLAAREIQIKDYPDSESEWHETREGGLPE